MHDFNFLYSLLTILVIFGVLQGACAYQILLERKISAWVQDRVGPNRVGPAGLLQPIADGIKFVLKEQIIPYKVDKFIYMMAPLLSISTAMLAFAVVPFGATEPPPNPAAYAARLADYNADLAAYRQTYQFVIAPGIDIGILFIFAISSLAVYGIILGGWAGNSKFSFLGGLRSSAQIISYEIPLGLSCLGVILMSGSLNLETIIWQQAKPASGGLPMWNVFYQPLAFLIFMVSAFAETNRMPFDLPESEQELVGGYHTEYSGWKMAVFFLGEYTHMITTSLMMIILFFGGWHFPWIASAESNWFFKLIVIWLKVFAFITFYMLIRWTILRFRFDQLMGLAWKVMIPLALFNLICVMFVMQYQLSPWILLPVTLGAFVAAAFFSTAGQDSAPDRVPIRSGAES